ncbi:protein transport protein sec31-like [Panicum virgatum]|uniref:protein transport protein sec31-like n=1 Tax=Panicum virgatum TaxID=38727 RepID=UPI0019D605BB|nr:protein transport protein sec31-like [Panicum virgatum]
MAVAGARACLLIPSCERNGERNGRGASNVPVFLLGLPAPLFPADSATPPAAALDRPQANSDFAFASRWHLRVAPEPPHRPPSSRWCSQAVPRTLAASRAAVPPPPQRRGGEPAAVPQTTNSRALENPEHRNLLFPHSFARSLLRKPQNAAAPSVVAGELRSAAADPLPPSPGSNPRHHELRLAPLKLLGPASPPNRHQSAAAIYLNAGKQAAAANPPFQTRSAPTDPAISTTRVPVFLLGLPAPLFPADSATPPAAALDRPQANSDFAFASRWHLRVAPEPPHRPPSSRWCSQAVPRTLAASRAAVPPPPQRRGGEPAAWRSGKSSSYLPYTPMDTNREWHEEWFYTRNPCKREEAFPAFNEKLP